jgi:hypothetical protein
VIIVAGDLNIELDTGNKQPVQVDRDGNTNFVWNKASKMVFGKSPG